MRSLYKKKFFVLNTSSKIKNEKQNLYFPKVPTFFGSQVIGTHNLTLRGKTVGAAKKEIRGFSTGTRIVFPKNLRTKRGEKKKFITPFPGHAKVKLGFKYNKNQGRGLLIKKRKFAWKKKSAARQKR
jgi:hypothetical protein